MANTLKKGDTVRYLNAVGGGVVTRIDGKLAYVLDNGFENPVLASELVVVMPAGHTAPTGLSAHKMFDQDAFDAGRSRKEAAPAPKPEPKRAEAPVLRAPDTDYGHKISLALAFEPSDVKALQKATFNAVLVNDSNFDLDFILSRRGANEREWTVVYRGTVPANELIDLAQYTHENLSDIERISLQALAYRPGKPFELKPAISITRRLDLTKFHKLHCFRPGLYFEEPVIEVQLMKDDVATGTGASAQPSRSDLSQLQAKWNADAPARRPKEKKAPKPSPTALLPLIEADLHMSELLDSTAGMDAAAMKQVQLNEVRRVMRENARRIGQKIVFIHGKGDGVLRKEVLALLAREYPKCTTQDASFREYGFGATLVTIH